MFGKEPSQRPSKNDRSDLCKIVVNAHLQEHQGQLIIDLLQGVVESVCPQKDNCE